MGAVDTRIELNNHPGCHTKITQACLCPVNIDSVQLPPFSIAAVFIKAVLAVMATLNSEHIDPCTARTGRGPKDEGRKKSRPITPVFLYLSRLFPYLQKNTEIGREAGDDVSRLYLRDPVFSRDNPVFFPYL